MKNKFNFKLFLDGMRQLRTIGIVSLVIFCLEAVFSVIGVNISAQTSASFAYDMSNYDAVMTYAKTYNLYELHPILLASFLILIPIMVLYMFGFLNKRNASDFYHCAPVKREALALSLLAAIMAWVFISVFASTALVCILTVFTQFVSINMYSMFVSFLATIVACLCVLGAGFFAMSITGTYFSNIAVSVMLLTAPRLIITTFMALISSLNPLLPFSFNSGILDYRLNIVVGSILSAMFDSNIFYSFEHFVPILYTLVLSIFYFAAGFYAFMKRKSEIATMPAANGKLQLLFRLVPSCLICLIPLAMISYYALDSNSSGIDSLFIFFIVLLYVIAIIVYFLYELISTKKFSNLLKSFKTIWMLAAFNIVFFVSLIIGYHVTLNDVPAKENVTSVMISRSQTRTYGYFANTSAQLKITDRELIDFCVDSLQNCVDAVKHDADGRRYYSNTIITFNTKGRTIKRIVSFESIQEYDRFVKLLNECDEYADVYKNIPEYTSLSNMELSIPCAISNTPLLLSSEDVREIYDSLRNEQMTLTFDKAYANAVNYSMTTSFGEFYGNYTVRNSNYRYAMYITDLTPKTALLLIDKINSSSHNNFSLSELSNKDSIIFSLYQDTVFDINTLDVFEQSIELPDTMSDLPAAEAYPTDNNSSVLSSKDLRSQLINELSKTQNMKVTNLDSPVVCVSYIASDNYSTERYARYFYATDEFIDLYEQYFGRRY